MTKGKLTPLALAIGFALCGTAFAGQNSNAFIDDNKTFDKTETIESDKATVVGSGGVIGGKRYNVYWRETHSSSR